MIDRQGYRPNVGIILCNDAGEVFWARRTGEDSWQFPQGGIRQNETPEQALYRELAEEVGLGPGDVEVLGRTQSWLRYRIPHRYLRHSGRNGRRCIGQKQLWYLLKLVGHERAVCLDSTENPEFDSWRWINYWETVDLVIPFKRIVYRKALEQLIPLINPLTPLKLTELHSSR
ncbi:MAG: RNA pyrophosphohydrolase [Gammaproteobacteria bacterium]|nr:RNA pyrophosphohydrolase [Gammaproteobacteria bacterium]